MALTVHLSKTPDHREIRIGMPTVVFETDGVSGFFFSTFERLGERTGKYVTPYDDAVFQSPEELDALASAFGDAAAAIEAIVEESVPVTLGTRMSDPPEEVVEADLVLHVVDASSPELQIHVDEVLH